MSPMGKLFVQWARRCPDPSPQKGTAASKLGATKSDADQGSQPLPYQEKLIEVRREVQARLYWGPACLLPEGGGAGSFWDQGERCVQDSGHGGGRWSAQPLAGGVCVQHWSPFRRGSWDLFWSWCVSLPIICPSCLEKRAAQAPAPARGARPTRPASVPHSHLSHTFLELLLTFIFMFIP